MGPLEAGLEACGRRLSAQLDTPLAVAFSGGGDSLALLLVARAVAERSGRRLIALHVDHALQAPSHAWAADAAAVAGRLGAPCRILRWEGCKPATGLPAAARIARHRLIAEAAREAGAQVILLGHTFDDQLENAVMRQAGAPVGALNEWAPSPVWPEGRGLFLCRPLLTQRRAALRAWLSGQGMSWLEDPANDDQRYARARARRAVDDGASGVLAPGADVTGLGAGCRWTGWGGGEIDRSALLAADPGQALRLLQIAAACASGAQALARPTRAKNLLARLRAGERFVATLAGARIEASAASISLCREAGEAARGGLAPLALPIGQPAVWDGRYEFTARDEGLSVEALRGQAARLAPPDAARLRTFPAPVRPSLPVLRSRNDPEDTIRLALTWNDHHIEATQGVEASVLTLAPHRFAAAAGLVAEEIEIGTIADMANPPAPPYVEAEARTYE